VWSMMESLLILLAGVVVIWGLAKSDDDVGLESLLDHDGFLKSYGDRLEV
jgi:hypothetical protein